MRRRTGRHRVSAPEPLRVTGWSLGIGLGITVPWALWLWGRVEGPRDAMEVALGTFVGLVGTAVLSLLVSALVASVAHARQETGRAVRSRLVQARRDRQADSARASLALTEPDGAAEARHWRGTWRGFQRADLRRGLGELGAPAVLLAGWLAAKGELSPGVLGLGVGAWVLAVGWRSWRRPRATDARVEAATETLTRLLADHGLGPAGVRPGPADGSVLVSVEVGPLPVTAMVEDWEGGPADQACTGSGAPKTLPLAAWLTGDPAAAMVLLLDRGAQCVQGRLEVPVPLGPHAVADGLEAAVLLLRLVTDAARFASLPADEALAQALTQAADSAHRDRILGALEGPQAVAWLRQVVGRHDLGTGGGQAWVAWRRLAAPEARGWLDAAVQQRRLDVLTRVLREVPQADDDPAVTAARRILASGRASTAGALAVQDPGSAGGELSLDHPREGELAVTPPGDR